MRHVKSAKTAVEGKTGIDYVRFQQYYDNLPVVGTETLLHTTETGRVFQVHNRFFPGIQPVNSAKISREEAIKIARNKLKGKKLLPVEDMADLTVYPKDNKFYYAWQVQVNQWRFYIDAESSNVIKSFETVLYGRCGRGKVYVNNSCETPDRVEKKFCNLDDSRHLWGTYFKVKDASSVLAMDNNGVYNYSVDDYRAKQVEIYYQLERGRTFFAESGFQPWPTHRQQSLLI